MCESLGSTYSPGNLQVVVYLLPPGYHRIRRLQPTPRYGIVICELRQPHKPEFVQKGEERWQTLLMCTHFLSNLLAASGNDFIFKFNTSMSSTSKFFFFFFNYSSLYRHLNILLYTCPPLNWGENQIPAQYLYIFCTWYSVSVMFYTQLFIFSSFLEFLQDDTVTLAYLGFNHICACVSMQKEIAHFRTPYTSNTQLKYLIILG